MTDVHMSPRTLARYQQVQALLDQLHPEAQPQALLVPRSPQPQQSVIVFTGSFNPPTTAHLAMLKRAYQYAHTHEPMGLYAAFSKHTVDKERVERPLLLDRIVLLNTLLKHRLPHAGIMLFNRGLYVEQAEAIRGSFRRVKHILFLMGFDKIVQIFDAHYYNDRDKELRQLFALAQLLVAPRGNDGEQELAALIHKPENEPFAQYVHPLPLNSTYRNISSTRIRESAQGSTHDIPHEVREFMLKTRAYAPPLRRSDGTEVDFYAERMKALESLLR
ncbi:MAG: hypothetical protein JO202_03205 [Ktedonobacteraceae bacterium]|nr:hypothetical protein [Ktedonobacteraceae bacterium]